MVSGKVKIDTLTADGYGRFFIIRNILDILYGRNEKSIKLIDVGGGSQYMPLALDNSKINYDLTSLDMVPRPQNFKKKYIVGDATDMPLKDCSFDTAISTDVLEHIPDDKKLKFVQECLRVASDFVVISAPFDGPVVNEAEELTNNFNKKIFNQGQEWLEDHFKNHKPKKDDITKFIEKLGYNYISLGSNNIYSWILSTHLNLMDAGLGLDHKRLLNLNSRQNKNILISGDMQPPHYRQTIVVFKKNISPFKKRQILELGQHETDSGVVVEYLNETMSILAERIAELRGYNSKYVKQIEALNNETQQQEKFYQSEIEKYETFSIHNLNLSIPARKIVKIFRNANAKEK